MRMPIHNQAILQLVAEYRFMSHARLLGNLLVFPNGNTAVPCRERATTCVATGTQSGGKAGGTGVLPGKAA
jgi:hypothetical protein